PECVPCRNRLGGVRTVVGETSLHLCGFRQQHATASGHEDARHPDGVPPSLLGQPQEAGTVIDEACMPRGRRKVAGPDGLSTRGDVTLILSAEAAGPDQAPITSVHELDGDLHPRSIVRRDDRSDDDLIDPGAGAAERGEWRMTTVSRDLDVTRLERVRIQN